MSDDKLLTVKDVASLVQVEEITIYRACKAGKLRHIKISYKTIRFHRADVDSWLLFLRVGDEAVPELRHVRPQPRQIMGAM